MHSGQEVAAELGSSRVGCFVRQQMSHKHLMFDSGLAGSAATAAHNWSSNFGTLSGLTCSMMTGREEQRKAHPGE